MSKDMDLVMSAANSSGAVLPAASAAQSVLVSNVSTNGDLDLAAITPFVIAQRPPQAGALNDSLVKQNHG
jgi:hypothetical protein